MSQSLKYVDAMLGTNLSAEQKQAEPQKSEKEQLQEQLEILRIKKQMAELQQDKHIQKPTEPKLPPIPPPQEKVFTSDDYLPKKQAALEVLKPVKALRMVSLLAIGGLLITAIVSVFSSYGGAAVAGVLTIGLGYLFAKNNQHMKYLKETYNI